MKVYDFDGTLLLTLRIDPKNVQDAAVRFKPKAFLPIAANIRR